MTDPRITEDEFWKVYARRYGLGVEYLRTIKTAQRCYCGADYCNGWVMIPKVKETVSDEQQE